MNPNQVHDKDELQNLGINDNETGASPGNELENLNQADDEIVSEAQGAIDVIKKVQEEMEQMKDKFLRLNAEFDNYRRRTLKERMELFKTANADVIIAMLPVLDDFERAIKALDDDKNNSALEGVTLIYNKFKTILEQKGLKPMESAGQEFNVDLHDAITQIPTDDKRLKGKVAEEVEKGYYLNDKVIRHAKVVVYS